MPDQNPSMLKATAIGGLLFGIAGAIPLVNFINCFCCALIVAGGFAAAFIYSKDCAAAGVAFRPGNGAIVGLVAGLFYALANTVVSGIFRMLIPNDPEQMLEMLEQFNLPEESMDTAMRFIESTAGVMGLVIGFFVTLLLAAIFSTAGGLIGAAVFKVEPRPPAPPPMPVDPGV